MKTAIYIEDGTLQLVITPETEHEKSALKILRDKKIEAQLFDGAFYDCRGGWIRQSEYYRPYHSALNEKRDESLIIRVSSEP